MATPNLSTLRRIALNLLKTGTVKSREPICGKRVHATQDPSYLEAIIGLRQMEVPCRTPRFELTHQSRCINLHG